MNSIEIKRAYQPAETEDGARILVDRLWPRGCSHEKLALHSWQKEIAPSTKERQAFHTHAEDFETFARDYRSQLDENAQAADFVKLVKELLEQGNVTLVYGAKDTEHNNAIVLKEWLNEHLKQTSSQKT